MFAIIGSLVVLGSVLGGFMMGGSSLLLLWHPLEIVVICGAALGAFLISNPMKVIKSSFSGALGLVKGARYGRAEYIQLLKLVYDILVMARKDGVLAIERHIEDPAKSDIFKRYPFIMADHHMMEFITDCLRLISGGNLDPHELESLLEYELETHHKEAGRALARRAEGGGRTAGLRHRGRRAGHRQHHGCHRWREYLRDRPQGRCGAGGHFPRHPGPPTVLSAPSRPPWSTRRHEESKAFEVVKMALVASVRGYPPPVAVEFARKLLFSSVRPNFKDLEQELRGKKPAAG